MNKAEKLLEALLNGETENVIPQSRSEACLKNCLEGVGREGLVKPHSRMEAYLQALAEKIAEGGSGGGASYLPDMVITLTGDNFIPESATSYKCTVNYDAIYEHLLEGGRVFLDASEIYGSFCRGQAVCGALFPNDGLVLMSIIPAGNYAAPVMVNVLFPNGSYHTT